MRIKVQNILFVLLVNVICMSAATAVNAQDASFPGTETSDLELDKEKEKLMFSPGELDPTARKNQSTSYKDSVSLKPVNSTKIPSPEPPKTPGKQPAQDDDSILSFNFLYYIFQKYKLQDMVD